MMMTFADDILAAAGEESIEAISLGEARGSNWCGSVDNSLRGPVSWSEAFPILNYEYDAGYGGQDCHDIWAWTATRVLFVHEYDGSTYVASAPRNPCAFSGATQ